MPNCTARLPRVILAGLALAALSAGGTGLAQDQLKFFTIGTSASSSSYFMSGALISNIISNPPGSRECESGGSCGVPGLIAVAQTTQGSVENMRRIGAGKLDSGLSRSNIADWAYEGSWMFAGEAAIDNLRVIANLYPEELHVVVPADSDIRSIAELRGRKVALGEAQSGTRFESLLVLRYYGITADDIEPFYVASGHAADLLEAGEIDAFFVIASAPVAAIARLAKRKPIRLLPIEETVAIRINREHPFFDTAAILTREYDNVPLTPTLGIGTVWVTSAEADEELIYQITRSLWHERNRALIDRRHPKGMYIHQTLALEGFRAPLHPGAERYYREAGLIQ